MAGHTSSPALADRPRSDPHPLPPGLISLDGPGAGVRSTLGEVPAWPHLGRAAPFAEPGLFDRFYRHARRLASSSDLHAVHMPEVWFRNSTVYDTHYRQNSPQLESLLRSSMGRALLEEVLGEQVVEDHPDLAPRTAEERIRECAREGVDVQFSLRTTGVGGCATWNVGGLSVGSGYSTEAGRLAPVRLSYPFVEEETWGEVGVDSTGSAWLILHSNW